MTTTVPPSPYRNAAEWLDDLGDVPLERIMFDPWPGTATEADLLRKIEAEDHLCELINGTLVEKPAGFYESQVAMVLVQKLLNFILPRGLGAISGEAGPLRLAKGLVRLTDVAFVSSARLATADVRNQPNPSIAPDLAIEVLSKSNTRKEIEGKTEDARVLQSGHAACLDRRSALAIGRCSHLDGEIRGGSTGRNTGWARGPTGIRIVARRAVRDRRSASRAQVIT